MIEISPGELYVANNNGTIDIIRNDKVVGKSITEVVIVNKFKIDREGRALALTDAKGIYEITKNKFYRPVQPGELRSFFDVLESDTTLFLASYPEPIVV